MKKGIAMMLAVLLCLTIPIAAAAAELTGCTITAVSGAAAPGETVTMEIRIENNPGFTNFAIALDYDRNKLTLVSLEPIVGSLASASLNWQDADGMEMGYVVCASPEPIKENGVLFTATFEISADAAGEGVVTPQVQYIRNNEAVFSIFEAIRAAVNPGSVSTVLKGDISGDGIIEYNDVMLAYKAFLGETELTAAQMAAVDSNGNGIVEEAEYQAIYQIYIGGSKN